MKEMGRKEQKGNAVLKGPTVAIIKRGVRGVFICGLMNDALVYEVERYK